MVKVYDWIEQRPNAARVLLFAILVALLAGLTVPAVLFLPGFLDNLKGLHSRNPALFFGFIVAPAVIATLCAIIWSFGDMWERMGAALDLDDKDQAYTD